MERFNHNASANIRRLLTALLLSAAFTLGLLAPNAFAGRSSGDGINSQIIKRELKLMAPVERIRIEGTLSCDLGTENTGKGCELTLKEATNGKLYRLLEARSAMDLYLEGKKSVIIEGKLAGAETIEVDGARSTL